MTDYKLLSFRYLKLNKRRFIITAMGVALATMVLYALLNLGWCYILKLRTDLRKEQDYELILFTEGDTEKTERILDDENVKSAYVGLYYNEIDGNAISVTYVNTVQPYRMDAIFQKLCNTYEVEGTINQSLQEAYFQGDHANLIFLTLVSTILVAYIFAIFGIGIVSNTIQLSLFEQIKDYGNLRCIGASVGQLKSIIYLEGMIMELTGNILGIPLGLLLCKIAGYYLNIPIEFHGITTIPVFAAFLFDLYFVMADNCKVIKNMSPVSAIRGEYRIRKEKIKLRKKSVFGKLFGLEGDYAYKNVMRNPGRFRKTIWSMGIGIGATITCIGVFSTVNHVFVNLDELFGYYPLVYMGYPDSELTLEERQSELPSIEMMQDVTEVKGIKHASPLYLDNMLLVDWRAFHQHDKVEYEGWWWWMHSLSDSEKEEFDGSCESLAKIEENFYRKLIEDGKVEDGQRLLESHDRNLSSILLKGCDEEDYNRYKSVLKEGTLDLSENGILLINGGITEPDELVDSIFDDMEMGFELNQNHYTYQEYTDYKVGDTVTFVDIKQYHERYEEAVAKLKRECVEQTTTVPNPDSEEDVVDELKMTSMKQYYEGKTDLANQIYNDLIEQGCVKTYVIEGIAEHDLNLNEFNDEPMFVLPLNRYFVETGMTEDDILGMQYHCKHLSVKDYENKINAYQDSDMSYYDGIFYIELLRIKESAYGIFLGVMLVIAFFVALTSFNVMNTTASNIHMRKKEFAQLRVIGVSKSQLFRITMLEGVITTILANIIGIIISLVIQGVGLRLIYHNIIATKFYFPVFGVLITFVGSALLFCGCVYAPIRKMEINMAEDLKTGAE